MSAIFELEAELRKDVGKGASRRLRRLEDRVPAIMYGGTDAPQAITLAHNKVLQAIAHEAFFSHIITLKLAGKPVKAVVRDMHRHPFKKQVMHIDFQRISATDPITMTVPIHFVGAEEAPGVKAGGVLSHIISDTEIRCLPDKLPEYLVADVSKMEMDAVLHLSELTLPEGVEVLALSHGQDTPVASIHEKRVEAEPEETAAPEAAEVPASEQKEPPKEGA